MARTFIAGGMASVSLFLRGLLESGATVAILEKMA